MLSTRLLVSKRCTNVERETRSGIRDEDVCTQPVPGMLHPFRPNLLLLLSELKVDGHD
jgi:hypothetical protein